MRGAVTDTSRPVSQCGNDAAACIDWPFQISAPPRLPAGTSEVVRWSVDDHRFSIRPLPESPGAYAIEVLTRFRPMDGRPSQIARIHYRYSDDSGFESSQVEGAPESWRRCQGRLTFDDLRELTRRIPDDGIDPP
jgi:hypothetical protein